MQITTEGIVIRVRPLGDDDRLITILTRDRGVVTAFAGGARRLKSALCAGTELLAHCRFVLFYNREKYTVDRAETETLFFAIRQDIEKLSLASYLAQLCSELITEEDRPDPGFLRLMLNSLYMLEKDKRSVWQIKPLFELRLLSMSGYMPDLVECRSCGLFEGESMFFLPGSGELICHSCMGEGVPGVIELPAGVLAAMRHILYSDFDKLFHFALPQEGLKLLSFTAERYTLCQLERSFPSLEFFTQVVGMNAELVNR